MHLINETTQNSGAWPGATAGQYPNVVPVILGLVPGNEVKNTRKSQNLLGKKIWTFFWARVFGKLLAWKELISWFLLSMAVLKASAKSNKPVINSTFPHMRMKHCHDRWWTETKNWIILHVKEVCDLKQVHAIEGLGNFYLFFQVSHIFLL